MLKIYKNKKVLVTGHTGFKGSWLTLWLCELGAEVIGYSLEPSTNPNLFTILKLEDKISHNIGDIRDLKNVLGVFDEFKPEIVFHLAAQPLVRLSYIEPILTYETNVMGTANILEAIRLTDSVHAGVMITTDKCYENKEWIYGYRENDPLGGYDPYSSSKGACELVINAYRNSYFHPEQYGSKHHVALASVRAGNVIGGGDWSQDRLIPDCIRSLKDQEKIVLRNPDATRPWQHVLEPLSGYLLLGKLLLENGAKYSESWNFGPDDEGILKVEDIVKLVLKYWGSGSYNVQNDTGMHEASLLKLDISKAMHFLKWFPKYSIEKAVKETVNWYKEYYENNDMIIFSRNQIIDFMKQPIRGNS